MAQRARAATKPATEALFVRIPAEHALRLDRAAFQLRRPKQALVAQLLERYIDPDSPASLAALAVEPAPARPRAAGYAPAGARAQAARRRVTVETLEPDAMVVGHHAFRPLARDEPQPAAAEVLSLEQASQLLQVERSLLARLAERGELPGRKLGSHWRFARAALIAWLACQAPTGGERDGR